VARDLIGALLVSNVGGVGTAGRIVETEAYEGPGDPASHAWGRTGRTARNDPLFGPPGTAYLHRNYGIHWCFNVVTAAVGMPHGVLVRALEPAVGLEWMRSRRGRDELTNGPARLVQALGLGPELQRHTLWRPPVWIAAARPVPDEFVTRTTRIGIRRGADRPWRFLDSRSAWVSHR
jgi:DNA-3-methyladenine glycosylase